ncbi:hypothetical protein TSAR_016133 [Trichomalopsis sarcophagae]|uniref:Uncharacterized protein n=1 Tax=Trichomalopsis sarcophagae TaxID=543379 RepID=A0A232FHC2_9HYME|nr:hypothetical protein TSAR_016133 [Trichomalopsis sarcophagae]
MICQDMFDLDDLLPILGEFGRYQKQLLWFICLPACLPCGFCAFNQLFMSNTPSHWCNIPELGTLNMSMRKMIAIPTVGIKWRGSAMKASLRNKQSRGARDTIYLYFGVQIFRDTEENAHLCGRTVKLAV